MTRLKELCEKYFDTSDIYAILSIKNKASEKQIKKAYYKVALKVHPDRVSEENKQTATEKFKVLGKIHEILCDKEKRAVYDETGSYDDEDDIAERNWEQYWSTLFKKITDQDIVNFENKYKGSEMEKNDLKHAYIQGKGCIDYITDSTPFARVEEEPRLIGILQQMIDENIIPKYDIFVNEPASKRKRRHGKSAKEAQDAENLNKMLEIEKEDLALAIKKKNPEESSKRKRRDRTYSKELANHDISLEIEVIDEKKIRKSSRGERKRRT